MAVKVLAYNVDHPVGKSCPNQGDDVLLVRFFLRRIGQIPSVQAPYSDMPLSPAYDDSLGTAILWFQKMVNNAGRYCSTDGKVSPAPKGIGAYTINHMTGTYRRHYPQFKQAIESDPQFPPALLASFSEPQMYK